jgi:leucyl-tRNA synthetase
MLIKADANVNWCRDDGRSVFHHARERGLESTVNCCWRVERKMFHLWNKEFRRLERNVQKSVKFGKSWDVHYVMCIISLLYSNPYGYDGPVI